MLSTYYDTEAVDHGVAADLHRDMIGGLWEELGQLQFEFLVAQGMTPADTLLDVGCGSFRLGVKAVPYLDAGHYFGVDLSASLIKAGYEREFDDDMRARVPLSHLITSADFDMRSLPRPMDFAIAQSVFTHLPLNHLRRCLAKLSDRMQPGGRFFVTYFECGPQDDLFRPIEHAPAGVVSHDYCDPYHYRLGDMAWAAEAADWAFEPIGDWGHPRGQRIVEYRRK
jgi:SAM-dependent methyltransferase